MATIATLQRISASQLAAMILAAEKVHPATSLAIIDVRDDDHIGGHIVGSMHIPSRSWDTMLPTLMRKVADKETVVFHCALSQQRGPSAALKYLREMEQQQQQQQRVVNDVRESVEKGAGKGQKVYVLDRGFVGWQEKYGEDERLTEGYRKDIWEDGY